MEEQVWTRNNLNSKSINAFKIIIYKLQMDAGDQASGFFAELLLEMHIPWASNNKKQTKWDPLKLQGHQITISLIPIWFLIYYVQSEVEQPLFCCRAPSPRNQSEFQINQFWEHTRKKQQWRTITPPWQRVEFNHHLWQTTNAYSLWAHGGFCLSSPLWSAFP